MIIHKGKEYVRVSEVLDKYKNFGRATPEQVERKRLIGVEVHQAIEDDNRGDFPILNADSQGYFGSYLKWKEQLDVTFFASEERYFCDEKRLTGKIDALVNPFNEHMIQAPILVDFKCTSAENKTTWPLQAHLYAYLVQTNGILISPYFLFVRLDEHGGLPQVCRYEWNANTDIKAQAAIADFWINYISVADK